MLLSAPEIWQTLIRPLPIIMGYLMWMKTRCYSPAMYMWIMPCGYCAKKMRHKTTTGRLLFSLPVVTCLVQYGGALGKTCVRILLSLALETELTFSKNGNIDSFSLFAWFCRSPYTANFTMKNGLSLQNKVFMVALCSGKWYNKLINFQQIVWRNHNYSTVDTYFYLLLKFLKEVKAETLLGKLGVKDTLINKSTFGMRCDRLLSAVLQVYKYPRYSWQPSS